MDFKFQRQRLNTIPESRIIDELEKAAKHFQYITFGRRDFDKVADVSSSVVRKHFGSWGKALIELQKHLEQKGLNILSRPNAPNRIHSNKDLFEEMERIWQKVGQRPSQNEWELSNPKISYQCYKQRFGGWTNACLKFIEYKMGKDILADDFVIQYKGMTKNVNTDYKPENSRNIPLGLRLMVLKKYNFRCVFCGKSPATDFGTKLHIDHIKPFSKGGKSSLENLQALCEECNLGKSDREI